MTELQLCPFCGTMAFLVRRPNKLYDIGCDNDMECFGNTCLDPKCNSCTDGYKNKKDAIKAWNCRSNGKESKCD